MWEVVAGLIAVIGISVYALLSIFNFIIDIQQHRRSTTGRLDNLRNDLLARETLTGQTYVNLGDITGLGESDIIRLAQEEGFAIAGNTDGRFKFQRELPKSTQPAEPLEHRNSIEQYLKATLPLIVPDIEGYSGIEVT